MIYPGAVQRPLSRPDGLPMYYTPDSFQKKYGRPYGPPTRIILHITQGSRAMGAISWWEDPQNKTPSSAHFVVDRDSAATVYQTVDTDNRAWHASQCNASSIGIEHAALSVAGAAALRTAPLMATDAQYAASARLVAWLCKEYSIPCDRLRVLTHNEASPADKHVECCTGALNPDAVVQMAMKIVAEAI